MSGTARLEPEEDDPVLDVALHAGDGAAVALRAGWPPGSWSSRMRERTPDGIEVGVA